jgi:Ser/Thr protein kinase RdoA (MazF antagonist)
VGVTDRYWGPIEPSEAAAVLGRPVEIVAQHLRWLFAVARCRWDGGEAIVKRQPPMGRDPGQLHWQHRLANHLADRGVPAVRSLGFVMHDDLWYELFDVARGDDTYAGVDTWEPFRSPRHVESAGRVLAALHEAGADFEPRIPQPHRGFVVQLDTFGLSPVEAVELLAGERPAVAAYLAERSWRGPVQRAYTELFDRLRPMLPGLPTAPLHGDWQTNNLFFRDDEVSAVIDFHQADYAQRLLDLAVAVERNCFFWNRISDGDDEAYDLEHARLLIEAYHAHSPISEAERSAFADVLAACQFEYGISFLDYYWGIERDEEKADWAWETFVLGHALWWQSEAGQRARAGIEAICAALVAPAQVSETRRPT